MNEYFKLIEQKRQQKNMSIFALCKKVDISEMTYYNAKANKRVIGVDKFIALCKAVGITTLEII